MFADNLGWLPSVIVTMEKLFVIGFCACWIQVNVGSHPFAGLLFEVEYVLISLSCIAERAAIRTTNLAK